MLAHVEPGTVVISDGWPAIRRPAARSTPTGPSPSLRPAPRPTRCSPACTASRRSPSAGCWAPTKGASSPGTCRPTWTSSRSASTADAHARGMLFYRLIEQACRPPRTYRSLVVDSRSGAAARYPRRPTNAYDPQASPVIPSIARGASLRGDPWSDDVASGRDRDGGPISGQWLGGCWSFVL